MNLRRCLLWLHRWVGVLAGLVILVVVFTGGALVFERKLDRWLTPKLYPAKLRPPADVPVQVILDGFRERHPRSFVAGLKLPRDRWDALVLFSGKEAFHFDPGTGEELGSRLRQDGIFRTMTKLHVNLLSGENGGRVVAGATMLTVGLALTGLWLWWPLRIFGMGRGGSFRRFNLELHSVAGLYSSVFQLIIAGTGLTLYFLHLEHPEVPRSGPPEPGRARITVDDAIAGAERALPGARAVSSELPPPPNPRAPFRVQLAFPEDHSPAGRSVVFLDQYSGATLGVTNAREGPLLSRYLNLQLSIHTGGVFGVSSQWLAFLACVALLLQILSGYVLWWKRS